jgi:alkylhydroperoxidase family enzyme
MGSHAAVAAELLGDRQLVADALSDVRSGSIPARLQALLAFVEKAARDTSAVNAQDLDAARAAGWTDDALYDAITVCALFRFYNTWVDASGVASLQDYTMSGQRLASDGYVPEPR